MGFREPRLTFARVSLGESLHVLGAEGLWRAKRWLERTGRADVPWVRTDRLHTEYLSFTKPDGSTFSFDLGGYLNGAPFNEVMFFAEVKNYTAASDQNTHYEEYLAKCYRTTVQTNKTYEFMWITWHPFNLSGWSKLCSSETLVSCVEKHKDEYLAHGENVDEALCGVLADRLWLLVLSEKQENLCLTDEMVGTLKAEAAKKATLRP
jgi:hypothetical protein